MCATIETMNSSKGNNTMEQEPQGTRFMRSWMRKQPGGYSTATYRLHECKSRAFLDNFKNFVQKQPYCLKKSKSKQQRGWSWKAHQAWILHRLSTWTAWDTKTPYLLYPKVEAKGTTRGAWCWVGQNWSSHNHRTARRTKEAGCSSAKSCDWKEGLASQPELQVNLLGASDYHCIAWQNKRILGKV